MSFRRIISVLMSLSLLAVMPLRSQDTSVQTSRKERLEKEIAIIDKQLRDNAARNSNALNTLNLTRQKIELRKGVIAEGELEISRLTSGIRAKQRRIDSRRSVWTL